MESCISIKGDEMINKEDFLLHKDIVDWLVTNYDCEFHHAMAIVSYAVSVSLTIPEAYIRLKFNRNSSNENCMVESNVSVEKKDD